MSQSTPYVDPAYPGWYWDPTTQQWHPVPGQSIAPQQPAAPTAEQTQQLAQYVAQYQQWQANYAQTAAPRIQGATIGMHLKRAIDWNVSDVMLSPREKTQLDAAGVGEPRMQAFLAWRRSTMLMALPILLLGVILSFVDAGKKGTDGRTDLGNLVLWLPSISLALVPIGAWVAISRWTELRKSSRTLIICWALSIVVPLLIALLPIDAIYDVDSVRATDIANGLTASQAGADIFSARVLLAVQYALALLPVIITVPSGVIKGAGRVKFLFPAAALPGWFLITVAPFYSIFLVVVFVLIDQIVGNFLLVVGVGVLAFTPWLFVLRRKIYGRSMSIAEAQAELPKAGRLGGYLTFAGFALVVIFMLTAKVEGMRVVGSDSNKAVFSYLQVGRTAVEVFGRNLITAVVFCMIFLSMVFAEWRAMQELRPDIRAEHDMEMQALRRYTDAHSASAATNG